MSRLPLSLPLSLPVYTAVYWVNCEGGDLIGVYSSLEAAQHHADGFLQRPCEADSVSVCKWVEGDGDEWACAETWKRHGPQGHIKEERREPEVWTREEDPNASNHD